MPPRVNSRYQNCRGIEDAAGNLFLTERTPFRYDEKLAGTTRHVVEGTENLWQIAGRYYRGFPGAEEFGLLIAEFQPNPILDPSLTLETGRVIYVPSLDVILNRSLATEGD